MITRTICNPSSADTSTDASRLRFAVAENTPPAETRRAARRRQELQERLCRRLLVWASVDLPRWQPCPPGFEIAASEVVAATLQYLERNGHVLPPVDAHALTGLTPHAERAAARVYQKMRLHRFSQRKRGGSALSLEDLGEQGLLDTVLFTRSASGAAGTAGCARLYDANDELAGQTGRECLDFLLREMELPEARARALLLYWASARKSWREVVRTLDEAGLPLSEYERKCLPQLAEKASARLRDAGESGDNWPTEGTKSASRTLATSFQDDTPQDRVRANANFAVASRTW